MTLIVEDGTGLENAEAYISATDATVELDKLGYHGFGNTPAIGELRVIDQPEPGDSFTIGLNTYTLQANGSLTDVDGNIEIGLTVEETRANITNAVNLSGTPGVGYAASTTENEQAAVVAFQSDGLALVQSKLSGAAGNTVVTTANFDSANNGFGASVLSGGDDRADIALRKASSWLDGSYRHRGNKTKPDQSLEWPRSWVYSDAGYRLDSVGVVGILPTDVKVATAIVAFYIDTGAINPDVPTSQPGSIESERVKVGPIESETRYAGGSGLPSTVDIPEANRRMRRWIWHGYEVIRG